MVYHHGNACALRLPVPPACHLFKGHRLTAEGAVRLDDDEIRIAAVYVAQRIGIAVGKGFKAYGGLAALVVCSVVCPDIVYGNAYGDGVRCAPHCVRYQAEHICAVIHKPVIVSDARAVGHIVRKAAAVLGGIISVKDNAVHGIFYGELVCGQGKPVYPCFCGLLRDSRKHCADIKGDIHEHSTLICRLCAQLRGRCAAVHIRAEIHVSVIGGIYYHRVKAHIFRTVKGGVYA